jgi:hypothetical protein
MFEESLAPDFLDCILELHMLKEKVKKYSDEKLVDFVIENTIKIETDLATEKAIADYFNNGYFTDKQRNLIENCVVNLKSSLCIDYQNGEILYTIIA